MTDIYDSISEQPLEAFRPQQQNANKHSQRGLSMLDDSLRSVGWFGAVSVAGDNQAFDGSLRLERINEIFNGAVPIVVDSDGTRPVIVRRTDIESADSPLARKASVLANRVAEASLSWDTDVLEEWNDAGDIEVDAMWFPDEMLDWDVEDYDAPTDEEDEEATEDLIEQA